MSEIRIQDDLYEAVNGEWLKTAIIPEDRPTTGGFSDLDQEVEKIMMNDFKDFSLGKKTSDIKEMAYAISLYKKVLDVNRRNEEGIKPVLPLLEKINSINSIEELNKEANYLYLMGVDLPIDMGVSEDMGDATKYSFILSGPSIILPDTTYYADDNQSGKQLLEVYKQMAKKMLEYTPLTVEEQEEYLNDTIKFDEFISKKVKSRLEWSEYYKCHNPMNIDEVAKYVGPFAIKNFLSNIYGDKMPDTVVVYDPKAIKEMNGYFTNDNLKLYVHWAYVKTLLKASAYLSEELSTLGKTYRRTLIGLEKDPSIEKQAYQLASSIYSEPVGVYYGREYFGEEAKKDVVDIVKKIIETYKLRMVKNTFLKEATKEKAIKKLSTIEIKMGYPDEIRELYSRLVFDEEDSLFNIVRSLMKVKIEDQLNKLLISVDRSKWVMPGHMVNACYNPSSNDITFPAAILQKPFYSLNQSVSENLGGIGAVIGHEISHAFDNNGANFDELGNLNNWWTEEDFATFKELTKDMIKQFDGIEYHGGKVNGELVVSENIADNGGMGVTLEIMHTLENPDYKAYFINWAKVWCLKAKEEYIQMLLVNDVHSPAKLRANMPPRNFKEWYDAFAVTDKDQMYIEEDKRISIW